MLSTAVGWMSGAELIAPALGVAAASTPARRGANICYSLAFDTGVS